MADPSDPRVYFIGAGPGDPELLTVKASRVIAAADLVLYAGSLVSPAIVALARPGAKVVDSAPLALDETHALLRQCATAGGLAARVHTGDPALYGAIAEQMALLAAEAIPYAVIPGVTSASAAAAAFAASFTAPEVTQTLILTRLAGRTPMPPGETLADLARHQSAMAVYLSAGDPEGVAENLLAGGYPPETPIAVVEKASWPDQQIVRGTLANIAETIKNSQIKKTAMIVVGPALSQESTVVSKLYDAAFSHEYR